MLRTIVLLFFVGWTSALEITGTEEGPCLRNVRYLQGLDPAWMDTLRYINGGSKYFLFYREARVHPQFREMREDEFYYGACFERNISSIAGSESVIGFGRTLGSFDIQPLSPEVYTFTPSNPETGDRSDYDTVGVTLTDHKTFVVYTACVEKTNQRMFAVVSLTPHLDRETEKLIEDHVVSLKFRRKNVIFLKYSNCRKLEETDTGLLKLNYDVSETLNHDPGFQHGKNLRKVGVSTAGSKRVRHRTQL